MAEKSYSIGSAVSMSGKSEIFKDYIAGTLTEIKAEDYSGVEKVGNYSFYGLGVNSIEIPNSVKEIGMYSYYSLPKITSIKLPKNLKTVGGYFLNSCSSLSNLDIEADLERAGEYSFLSLKSNLYNVYGTGKYIGKGDNPYYMLVDTTVSSSTPELVVHKDCELIADNLIGRNYTAYSYLNSCYFEEGTKIKRIPEKFLNGAGKLTTFTVPESVEYIGKEVLGGYSTKALTEIIFKNEKPYTVGGEFFAASPSYVKNLKKIKIENLGNWASSSFKSNHYLFSTPNIRIYDKDDNILEDIIIPEGTTKVSSYSFYSSASDVDLGIKTVVIPKSVNEIGQAVFYKFFSSSFTSITLPFVGRSRELDNITGRFATIFDTNSSATQASLPPSLKEIHITDAININDNAFEGLSKIETITLPETVKHIGSRAFWGCKNLKNISIPDSVESFGAFVFSDSGGLGLKEIKFPENLTTIGRNVYENANNAEVITFNAKNVNVSSKSESYMSAVGKNITEGPVLNIGENVEVLPNRILYDGATSPKLKEINFAENSKLHTLGYQAIGCRTTFFNTNINLPALIYFGEGNFDSSNITSLSIEDKGQTLELVYHSFRGLTKLTSISLPKNITRLPGRVFEDCVLLTEITYNGTVADWNAIEKEEFWDFYTPISVIHCTDGDISI